MMPLNLFRIAKIAGAIGAILATVIAIGSAWSTWDLPVIASRRYVNKEMILLATPLMGLAIEQRDRLKRKRDDDLRLLAASTDPATRDILERLVAQETQDIAVVGEWVNVLERLRGR